jgi:chemotaxis protein MotC
MRSAFRILLVACAAAAPMSAAAQGQDAQQPFELIRSLRVLQDRAAQGDSAAYPRQRQLSAQIAEQMIAANPSVWDDPTNVRAVVMYVLSGGEPRVLKGLFGRRSLPGVDEKLLNGALAYSEGRDADAAELLGAVDVRTLERNLGAHVALAQAVLLVAKDPKKAIALLDDARLLSPGTLIEEAALRRQASVVAAAGDTSAYNTLASHYLRRFPNSVYATSFREQFAAEVASDRYGQAPEQLAKLEAMLDGLDVVSRRQSYLLIAHQAVTGGRVELARLAARHAVALTTEGSAEHTRSRIYEAAILIITQDHDMGLAVLQSIDRSTLADSDAELLDAAMAVAGEVRRPLLISEPPVAFAEGPETPLPKSVELARKVMARVDMLLNEVSK